MSWKWAVAGAMALGLGAGGAAQATTYLVTFSTQAAVNGFGDPVPSFTPFVFQQTVHTGPFGFLGDRLTHNSGSDLFVQAFGGGAKVSLPPFLSGLEAAFGLDVGPLYGGYALQQNATIYPDHTDVDLFSQVAESAPIKHIVWADGYEDRTLDILLNGHVTHPPLITTFTEPPFIAGFTGGGDFTVIAQAYGSDSERFAEYSGTFTAREVPEPATWALMAAGFGLAGAGLRRRRALA